MASGGMDASGQKQALSLHNIEEHITKYKEIIMFSNALLSHVYTNIRSIIITQVQWLYQYNIRLSTHIKS